jgi:septal ring factor EnvC (AmiA/AmiB activator)
VTARSTIAAVERALDEGQASVAGNRADLESKLSVERNQVKVLEDEARVLRRQVEEVQEGAGTAARRLATLRQSLAHLESLAASLDDQRARREKARVARTVQFASSRPFARSASTNGD